MTPWFALSARCPLAKPQSDRETPRLESQGLGFRGLGLRVFGITEEFQKAPSVSLRVQVILIYGLW